MSKKACLVVLAVVLPSLGGCFSGEAYGVVTDDNTYSNDGRPAPGNNDYGDHLGGWGETQLNNLAHAGHSLHWILLHTNSEDVPYERWHDDQLPRAMFTIGKTFDLAFLNYDWDDPFMGERW